MKEPTREEIGDLLRRLVDTVVEMKDRAEVAEDFVLRTLRYADNNGDGFLADKARVTLSKLKGQADE